MSTFLAVWGAAFLVSVTCWGVGAATVTSQRPLMAMLGGWCGFLTLCAIPWVIGFSAQTAAPLFWVFFAAGLVVNYRMKRWPPMLAALICSGVISAVICAPCLLYDGALAYGAHGTDMWGYVCTAEWLNGHSTRDLPELGYAPMRFNWTWHVLTIGDRPLAYESLACLGSALHLTPLTAYFAYPVVLLSSLAMALAHEPGVFQIKNRALTLGAAVLVVFHPLIVFHWIAGFTSGAIVGLLIALAFAAIAVAEEGRARTEAFALGALMMVFCAALYTPQLMLLGPLIVVPPAALAGVLMMRNQGWRHTLAERPGMLTLSILFIAVILAGFTLIVSPAQLPGTGTIRWSAEVLAQFLGVFGGTSPYAWLYYRPMEPWDREPGQNPVGLAALALMAILFGIVSWRRWGASRDIRLPVMILICIACLLHGDSEERATMAKAMPVFGFALVFLLAAVSGEVSSRVLAFAAAFVCCQPALRSAAETESMLHPPYVMITERSVGIMEDGQNWLILGNLYFREDVDGFNWPKFPRMYRSITWFLPRREREQLALKYKMPAD